MCGEGFKGFDARRAAFELKLPRRRREAKKMVFPLRGFHEKARRSG